jgi:hypothetical protein
LRILGKSKLCSSTKYDELTNDKIQNTTCFKFWFWSATNTVQTFYWHLDNSFVSSRVVWAKHINH